MAILLGASRLNLTLEQLINHARADSQEPVADVRGILLPDIIAELVRQSFWHDLGLLWRWGPVFPNWPAKDWASGRVGFHEKPSGLWASTPTEDLFLPRVFQHMAASLRGICSDLPPDRQDELKLAVEWLDDCHTTTGGLTPKALRWGCETQAGSR